MSPCACLEGCSHAANGAGEVDPESQRTRDSARKSNEWGKEGVRRGGATMNNVQKMKTGLLFSWCEVERGERGGVVSARCTTAEFIASGCLGNVRDFKKQLNVCRGWALVQLMTELLGSCMHLLEEKYIHMFVHTCFLWVSAVSHYRRQVRA